MGTSPSAITVYTRLGLVPVIVSSTGWSFAASHAREREAVRPTCAWTSARAVPHVSPHGPRAICPRDMLAACAVPPPQPARERDVACGIAVAAYTAVRPAVDTCIVARIMHGICTWESWIMCGVKGAYDDHDQDLRAEVLQRLVDEHGEPAHLQPAHNHLPPPAGHSHCRPLRVGQPLAPGVSRGRHE